MDEAIVNSSDAYKVYVRFARVYLALYLTHTLKESSCECLMFVSEIENPEEGDHGIRTFNSFPHPTSSYITPRDQTSNPGMRRDGQLFRP